MLKVKFELSKRNFEGVNRVLNAIDPSNTIEVENQMEVGEEVFLNRHACTIINEDKTIEYHFSDELIDDLVNMGLKYCDLYVQVAKLLKPFISTMTGEMKGFMTKYISMHNKEKE